MKTIIVNNCQECPFCNNDNEYGYDCCNLDQNIHTKAFDQMPKEHVHEKCPLKQKEYIIKTKKL
jgi:hypothetical protein